MDLFILEIINIDEKMGRSFREGLELVASRSRLEHFCHSRVKARRRRCRSRVWESEGLRRFRIRVLIEPMIQGVVLFTRSG
jgi:hypothetical protein